MVLRFAGRFGLLVALAIFGMACAHRSTSVSRYPATPVDEACAVADLCEARAVIVDIARRRDASAIEDWLADVVNDAPSDRSYLLTNFSAADSSWVDLLSTLLLGGRFRNGQREFCAPYTLDAAPPEALRGVASEGGVWAVVEAAVPVRREPTETSRIVGNLSYEWVGVLGAFGRFAEVKFPGGSGWIPGTSIRDPEGHYVCLSRDPRDSKWRITQFRRLSSR